MDPDKALADIRRLVAEWEAASVGISGDDEHDIAHELVITISGLDEWLTKGGFAPRQWQPGPKRPSDWTHGFVD